MYDRWYASRLKKKLKQPYVHLIFGARQTGKTTLLNQVLPSDAVRVDLSDPQERDRYLIDSGLFLKLCRNLPEKKEGQFVFVDEAQTVPSIFDAVQHLYDKDKKRWRFILCGSSTRKLRKAGANLLPGRSFVHRLYPLTTAEHPPITPPITHAVSPLPFGWPNGRRSKNLFPAWDLETRLAYGALPGVVAAPEPQRTELLRAFSFVHLEEEIRREALVRDWGVFLRFLKFAATESGQILNYTGISQETGISQPTVKVYYQLLEDMFAGFPVLAYSGGKRKNLLSTPKFLFFDLGVRHAAAGLAASPELIKVNPGPIFEQWVGIELWKRAQYLWEGNLYYQCSQDGREIDFIIEHRGKLTPIEVKWTERPCESDARHLRAFMKEHPKQVDRAYIICRCSRPLEICEKVTALPWFCL